MELGSKNGKQKRKAAIWQAKKNHLWHVVQKSNRNFLQTDKNLAESEEVIWSEDAKGALKTDKTTAKELAIFFSLEKTSSP